MTECTSPAVLIACAIFAADFRPLSDSIRRVARDAVEEVNKVFVLSAALGAEAGAQERHGNEVKRHRSHDRHQVVAPSF